VKLGLCTIREEHRVRVFENRLPRRIFGPKSYERTGGWRKLRNEERFVLVLFAKYNRTMSRTMRLAGYVVRMGKQTNAYRILAGKPEGKKY
jgi:hypothetical protein